MAATLTKVYDSEETALKARAKNEVVFRAGDRYVAARNANQARVRLSRASGVELERIELPPETEEEVREKVASMTPHEREALRRKL